jgi:molecular chaperone GrpE
LRAVIQSEEEMAIPENGPEAAAEPAPVPESAGAAIAAQAGLDEIIEALRQEVEALRQKLLESQDRTLRIQAEAENQRKRLARDMESAGKYALERFIADLIPVIDSLELGLNATGAAADLDGLRQGMELTLKKFLDTLARFGVSQVNPVGEKFNPDRHEAVSVQVVEGAEPNTIASVMQKGYELNGRLVRPAMVVIVKGN